MRVRTGATLWSPKSSSLPKLLYLNQLGPDSSPKGKAKPGFSVSVLPGTNLQLPSMKSKNRCPVVPETRVAPPVPRQKLAMNTLTCRTYPVQGASQETVNLKRKKIKAEVRH